MADRQQHSKSVDEPTDHPAENKAAGAPPKPDNTSTEESKIVASPDLSAAQPDARFADAKPIDAPSAQATGSTASATSPAIAKQIEAATALAQKLTLAGHSGDHQADKASDIDKASDDAAGKTPAMVALVLARTELKSMSDLAGKVVAVDERHSASDRDVRPALIASGASDIQIRESGDDAVAQLVEGQVPAVVLALASQDAADAFPTIPGFRLLTIPLPPRSQ